MKRRTKRKRNGPRQAEDMNKKNQKQKAVATEMAWRILSAQIERAQRNCTHAFSYIYNYHYTPSSLSTRRFLFSLSLVVCR